MRKFKLLVAATLAALFVLPAIAEDTKTHSPDHGPDLQRKLVPVEFKLLDASGSRVVIDEFAARRMVGIRLVRFVGDYSWHEQLHDDEGSGKVTAGTLSMPGLEAGEYVFEAALGNYGAASHRFTVTDEPVKVSLRSPHQRKVVRVRFTDENGVPLRYIPKPPEFRWSAKPLAHHQRVLPEPVLRLPPERIFGRGGAGGFGHRRARSSALTLTDDGWCSVTVFDGPDGQVVVPLGEQWFGRDSMAIAEPFAKEEHVLKLQPTPDWLAIDPKTVGVENADDPGLRKRNEPKNDLPSEWQVEHTVRLELAPTVAAWARFGSVRDRGEKAIECRYLPGRFEFRGAPEAVAAVLLTKAGSPEAFRVRQSSLYVKHLREERSSMLGPRLRCDGTGRATGTFFRVLVGDGSPALFVEASPIPLDDDEVAAAMRELEGELTKEGKRPAAPESVIEEAQELLVDLNEYSTDNELRTALGGDCYRSLQKREFRLRYARYGAWYDSHRRMDGDESGYVIAPHVRLEKDKLYALYIWGPSRDDLKPDLRVVVRGQGESTDLGVIRLP